MTQILRIDASLRQHGSKSRLLADHFLAEWLGRHPHSTIEWRDLGAATLPHLGADTVEGFYTPAAQRDARLREALALSDTLIAELRSAEMLVVATPMYNFGIPSALKAWIDHVVRIHETVAHDGATFRGLMGDRRAVVIGAAGAGSYAADGTLAGADFAVAYLAQVLRFLGFSPVETVLGEDTNGAPAAVEGALDAARRRLSAIAAA
jgi:FMN-dependent NADH-azoreductase